MRALRGTRLASATVVMTLTLVPALVHGQAQATPSKSNDEEKAKRFQLLVHANYQPTLRNFDEATSFTQFLEQGSTQRTYSGGSGTAFELGGVFSLTPELALMGSFEILSATHDATLDISVPVWSKYSNAQRVNSLHLPQGRLNPPSRSDTYSSSAEGVAMDWKTHADVHLRVRE